jgi:hypothetical protein
MMQNNAFLAWAAALLVRSSAKLPFLWRFVLYQTCSNCSINIELFSGKMKKSAFLDFVVNYARF